MPSRKRRSAPIGCASSRISTTGELRIARSRAVIMRRAPSLDDSKPIGCGIASELVSARISIGALVSARGDAFLAGFCFPAGFARTFALPGLLRTCALPGFAFVRAFALGRDAAAAFGLGFPLEAPALAGFFFAGFLPARAMRRQPNKPQGH